MLTHYQRPRGRSTQWNFLFENNAKCFRPREILSGAELLNTWNRGINQTQFYLFSSHCNQPSSVKSTISHPIGKSIAFWLLLAIRIDQPVFQFSSTNPTTSWSLLNLVCVGCHSKSLVFGNQERSRHQSMFSLVPKHQGHLSQELSYYVPFCVRMALVWDLRFCKSIADWGILYCLVVT